MGRGSTRSLIRWTVRSLRSWCPSPGGIHPEIMPFSILRIEADSHLEPLFQRCWHIDHVVDAVEEFIVDTSSKDGNEGLLIITGSILQRTEFDNIFFDGVGALLDFFDLLLCRDFFVDISELFPNKFEEFSMIRGGKVR